MAVSSNLKEIRKSLNLNQDDLAIAIGAHPKSISRIERGERNASLELALRLARYLSIPVEELFELDDYSPRVTDK